MKRGQRGSDEAKFAEYLPFAGLVDDGIMITKDAHLLRTFRVRAQDLSFAEDYVIGVVLRNLNNAFRWLGEGWMMYVDALRMRGGQAEPFYADDAPAVAKEFEQYRRESVGPFYSTLFFVTFGYNVAEKKGSGNFLFSNGGGNEKDGGKRSLQAELAQFKSLTNDIHNMFDDAFRDVDVLDNDGMLTYLHGTFGDWHPVRTPDVPFYLDHYLSDAKVELDSVTKLNDLYVLTASLHDFPDETHAGMVSRMMQARDEFRLVTRYEFLSRERARGLIKDIRKTYFGKRKGAGAMMGESVGLGSTDLEDTEATSHAAEASQALSTLSEGDGAFGHLTTTLVVKDRNYKNGADRLEKLRKMINAEGFICKPETFGNPYVFLGSIPGNAMFNPRKPVISSRNLAHFFPLSDSWEGNFTNEHLYELTGADWPHMTCRSGGSPFYLNLNVGDVGHTLVLGPTGAGKSILLNTLALQWLRYPGTRVVFFDKDKSSEPACLNAGGSFYDIGGPNTSLRFNLFSKIEEKSHRAWLVSFLGNFLRNRGVPMGPQDDQELWQALEAMAGSSPDKRTFQTFRSNVQEKDIRAGLTALVEGEYADLFSAEDDSWGNARWVTFEMNRLMAMSAEIVQFILGYVFYRLVEMFDGTPTLLVLDEAWLFLDNEYFAAMLRDWLKTLRKKNVYVVLATQEVADARNTIFSTILNACNTRILLPNPQATQVENKSLYHEIGLLDADIEALRDAQPKREYLYVSSLGKQMFELSLDRRQVDLLKVIRRSGVNEGAA